MSISHLVPVALLVLATTAGPPSPVPSTSQHHQWVVSEHCQTVTVTLPDGRTESVTVCHIPDWPPIGSVA